MNALKERLTDLWLQITAEPAKAGVLGGLLLVALILGVRAMALSGGGPSRASAAARAPAPIDSIKAKDAPQSLVFRPQDAVRRIETPPLERDIFSLHEGRFPRPPAEDPAGGKSAAQKSDSTKQGPAPPSAEERARAAVAGMVLRSTVLGAKPLAIIEHGETGSRRRDVLAMGDRIAGLRLVEITRDWVELEADGLRLRLEHAPPTR